MCPSCSRSGRACSTTTNSFSSSTGICTTGDSTTTKVRCCLPATSWANSGLDHLGVVEKAVKVVEEQQGGAVALGQARAGRAAQPAGRPGRRGAVPGCAGQAQAAGDVPDGDLPVLRACWTISRSASSASWV